MHINRHVVFLMPGPIHLFWCTGVFYMWELGKKYQIVLLVPENYKDNEQFNKILTCHFIEHVDYIPSSRIARHKYCATRLKALVTKFRPQFVFLNNRSYPENQYMLYWCDKILPNSLRIYFQNGRMALSWTDDFLLRQACSVERILMRLRLSKEWSRLAKLELILRQKLGFWFDYKIMPFLLIRRIMRPPINVLTGQLDRKTMDRMNRSVNDYLVAYLPVEIKSYESLGHKNIVQIDHPMKQSGKDVFEFIFGKFSVQKQILILPAFGFTSRLLVEDISEQGIIDRISNNWCEAIDALRLRYPAHTFAIKLHPAANNNLIWSSIQKNIERRVSGIVILPATQSAEWHVVQSSVIVSDVSTVLWWAALFGGKAVISFDIFGYPGGNEMRNYDFVTYVNSVEHFLNEIDVVTPGQDTAEQALSLLEFLQKPTSYAERRIR